MCLLFCCVCFNFRHMISGTSYFLKGWDYGTNEKSSSKLRKFGSSQPKQCFCGCTESLFKSASYFLRCSIMLLKHLLTQWYFNAMQMRSFRVCFMLYPHILFRNKLSWRKLKKNTDPKTSSHKVNFVTM